MTINHTRGPTLETVVVRMRILCEAYSDKIREAGEKKEGQGDHVKGIARTSLVLSIQQTGMIAFSLSNYAYFLLRRSVRIIALSATLPNLADIGDWLRCAPEVPLL